MRARCATGETFSKDYTNVWTVNVGFQGAFPYRFKEFFKNGGSLTPGLGGVTFESKNGTVPIKTSQYNRLLVPSSTPEQIYFPISGDYSPMIEIKFHNGTSLKYTYDNIKIPVASDIEIQNLKIGQYNLEIAFVLFLLTIVQSVKMGIDWVNNAHETKN